jgi:hypothetical protein
VEIWSASKAFVDRPLTEPIYKHSKFVDPALKQTMN